MAKTKLSFSRDQRLRRRSDFTRVQSSSQRQSSANFTFLLARRESSSPSALGAARLGLVVTKKVGCAPQRNRVKRVCRECFRTWPQMLPEGVDLVVIARPGAVSLSQAQVRAEWERVHPSLLRKARSLHERRTGPPLVRSTSGEKPAATDTPEELPPS